MARVSKGVSHTHRLHAAPQNVCGDAQGRREALLSLSPTSTNFFPAAGLPYSARLLLRPQ